MGGCLDRELRLVSCIRRNFYNNIVKVASFSHAPTLGCAAAPPGPGPGRPWHRAAAEDGPERLRAAGVPELSSSSGVPS